MDDDRQAVIAAEQALAQAHLTLDLDVIESLLHEDYLIIQPGGTMESKRDVLASYRSGSRHWDTAVIDQLEVRLYGSMARVVGRWRASGQNGTVHFDYAARFLSIWVKENGRWQNIAYQSAELL